MTLPSAPSTTPHHGSVYRLAVRGCVLGTIGGPIAIVAAFAAVKFLGAAASDCEAYEAGDRFGLLFFVFPALSVVLWVMFLLSALVVGRWSPVLGVAAGLVLVILIAYSVAGSAPATIRQAGDLEVCPGGIPDWWPWFLPR